MLVVVVERCKIIKSLTMYVVGMTTLAYIEGYIKIRLLHIFLGKQNFYHQFMYPIIIQHAKRYKRDDDGCITSFFADEKSLVGARVGFFGKYLSNIVS
jgi:hypothetical protein